MNENEKRVWLANAAPAELIYQLSWAFCGAMYGGIETQKSAEADFALIKAELLKRFNVPELTVEEVSRRGE